MTLLKTAFTLLPGASPLPGTFTAPAASGQGPDARLPNVSYDPTRELHVGFKAQPRPFDEGGVFDQIYKP